MTTDIRKTREKRNRPVNRALLAMLDSLLTKSRGRGQILSGIGVSDLLPMNNLLPPFPQKANLVLSQYIDGWPVDRPLALSKPPVHKKMPDGS
jgi:hypothetical protein